MKKTVPLYINTLTELARSGALVRRKSESEIDARKKAKEKSVIKRRRRNKVARLSRRRNRK